MSGGMGFIPNLERSGWKDIPSGKKVIILSTTLFTDLRSEGQTILLNVSFSRVFRKRSRKLNKLRH